MTDRKQKFIDQADAEDAIAQLITGAMEKGEFSDLTAGAMLHLARQLKLIQDRVKRYRDKSTEAPKPRKKAPPAHGMEIQYTVGIDGVNKRRGRG